MRHSPWVALLLCLLGLLLRSASAADEEARSSGFDVAVESAQKALEAGNLEEAHRQIFRALERDAKSPAAWALRARWAAAAADPDEHVYALHRLLGLSLAQGAPKKDTRALRESLEAVDPIARRYLDLSKTFVEKLLRLAKSYRKARRPHSAIRVYQQVLTLDPERTEAGDAIAAISAAPDPSLAETARPKDLLADVSAEWMRAFDRKHDTWEERAELERENYTTHTDAGYEVLVRCAEAMEQMNAFYRVFFEYGEDGGNVPHIKLNIFRTRETYLELGVGPPVDWSKGHFTGGAVETWIGSSGFDSMTSTLFHEAAHQFISLATNAVGWLNEGLACFFEGCQIQSNGTVLMNRPASGRLFSLAGRMEAGWMTSAADGIDPADPSQSRPKKAPTFRIVIENDYKWGPPWYAPTWGLVFFLYNYQDPVDGRFIYRNAFRTYIDTSGGRTGKGAIENFEQVVLAHPKPLTKSLHKEKRVTVTLPATVAEVDATWKAWILELRDEQRGSRKTAKPFLAWARYAIERKDYTDAAEHFEKGLHETPEDVDLLIAFADLLAGRLKDKDRATKLLEQAITVLESAPEVDLERVAALEKRLEKLDASYRSLERVHRDLERSARAMAETYLASERYLMAMHVSRGLGMSLRMPRMLDYFKQAVKRSGKTLDLWQLAYNEVDLKGWATNGGRVFLPYGTLLRSVFGAYKPDSFAYSFLTMEKVTSGDFSLEAEVRIKQGEGAFAGLVFGRKSASAFHALILFPEGILDLASFYGAGIYKTWRHESIDRTPGQTDAERWHRLRVDVTGREVTVWIDGANIASQIFANKDVLRGRFGLITGPGKAQYRNVRYLAREANDPSARLEREIRQAERVRTGKRRKRHHVGFVPPWPKPQGWVQSARTSWDERGPVPTLLVLWSMAQNDAMPMHRWLAHVAQSYEGTGLEIVSVSEDADLETVKAYLAAHPFPGSVAVDEFIPEKGGSGTTMDQFQAGLRGYPYVLLLDIDQRVVWEGNPGFHRGAPWKPGTAVHVDAPLAELVKGRNLRLLCPWLKAWDATGRAAVRRGELEQALPLLRQSLELPADLIPRVAQARAMLGDIRGALEGIEVSRERLVEREAEPALLTLLAWAELLELPLEDKPRKRVLNALKGSRGKMWKRILKEAKDVLRRLEKGEDVTERARRLLENLGDGEGPILKSLEDSLDAALLSGNREALEQALREAPYVPAKWLAAQFFRF